ncbi:gamma-glutamyl-gamma-aminobutyrate hydrolase family protein [Salinactinospora qingdaonensis]|uniref:Gamma-glutamyl-gamma-aminobutyrate hydrolase family protein n=1 Tax=Salinactinospora qingdaonensis TaxID=702744 RepID=A0ABP7FHU9_9ACTN
MPPPLIGITSYLEPARWAMSVREAAVLASSYLREVDRAGGLPAILAPTHPSSVPDLVARFDGIIFSDGPHLDPALYNESSHARTTTPDARRDRFEIALAKAVVEAGLPFLAIARGAHVLNVATGGSLVQYLPETVGHERHASESAKLTTADLSVSLTSRLGEVLGDQATVRESHTQGFNRLGSSLSPVAWAADNSVEAVEVTGHPFGLGIQWHPEEGQDRSLFTALVSAANKAGASHS